MFTVPTFKGEFRETHENLTNTVTDPIDTLVEESKNGEEQTKLKEISKTSDLAIRSTSTITFSKVGPFHHLWSKEPQCSNFTTRFAIKGSIPLRALASYPGSGNTWIRYLIEAATGVYTGLSLIHI